MFLPGHGWILFKVIGSTTAEFHEGVGMSKVSASGLLAIARVQAMASASQKKTTFESRSRETCLSRLMGSLDQFARSHKAAELS